MIPNHKFNLASIVTIVLIGGCIERQPPPAEPSTPRAWSFWKPVVVQHEGSEWTALYITSEDRKTGLIHPEAFVIYDASLEFHGSDPRITPTTNFFLVSVNGHETEFPIGAVVYVTPDRSMRQLEEEWAFDPQTGPSREEIQDHLERISTKLAGQKSETSDVEPD